MSRIVIRGEAAQVRTASAFGMSGTIHLALLAWLLAAAGYQRAEGPHSVYEQVIQPHEKHVVWYNLRDLLPDVKPAEAAKSKGPARARAKLNQSIVAGKKDDARAPQMIAMPAPAIELPKALRLPNALAVAAPRPMRPFVPPTVAPKTAPVAPAAPDAPALAASPRIPAVELATASARPLRPFVPPPAAPKAAKSERPAIPNAPALAASPRIPAVELTTASAHPVRPFALPPAVPKAPPQTPAVLDAPPVAAGPAISAGVPRIPRGFVPPPSQSPSPPRAVAAAPALEAPTLPDATPTPGATATLAIVGLNPAPLTDIPPPPGSHEAGFSGGVKPKASDADSGANEAAKIVVPGLATRGGPADNKASLLSAIGPPTSRQSLLAALHSVPPSPPRRTNMEGGAAHVSSAPDRLAGRYVYTLAIQMPNVTSFSGSWIVWFAEHEPPAGAAPTDMRPPVALRKVDPKYIQEAVEEKVEGTVRLSAVIRRTGHVDSVELLQHLDARLDRSAAEALAKWEFDPARRDGVPVDIDAVFEIPFRLAPKPKR